MICQILFSRKNKKNIFFSLSSAESAHSVMSVKVITEFRDLNLVPEHLFCLYLNLTELFPGCSQLI